MTAGYVNYKNNSTWLVQEEKTMDGYYTSLVVIWVELKHYRPPPHYTEYNNACFEVFQKQQELVHASAKVIKNIKNSLNVCDTSQ